MSVDDDSREVVDIQAIIGAKNVSIDVRVTHPTAPSYVQAARMTLGVAKMSEASKIRKHRAAAEKVGAIFIPFVMETFGGFSNDASSIIKMVSSLTEKKILL